MAGLVLAVLATVDHSLAETQPGSITSRSPTVGGTITNASQVIATQGDTGVLRWHQGKRMGTIWLPIGIGRGEAVDLQPGSGPIISHVSAASDSKSSELPTPSTATLPRKLIRRPAIPPISLPGPAPTTPSASINPSHTLIMRPSISSAPSSPTPATTTQVSVNLPSKLIRRPSLGPTNVTAPASTAVVASTHISQTASPPVNGVIPSTGPAAEAAAPANTKSKNAAQAAIGIGSVTAPVFGPSLRSALTSAPGNPTPVASAGPLIAAAQSGVDPGSYPRKLTERPEVMAILAPPPSIGGGPPPSSLPLLPSSGTATLTWNASIGSGVAGYNVYVGTASGMYGPPINAGNVTAYQVTNLLGTNTYFFAVTAYNTSEVESVFSNEASKSIY